MSLFRGIALVFILLLLFVPSIALVLADDSGAKTANVALPPGTGIDSFPYEDRFSSYPAYDNLTEFLHQIEAQNPDIVELHDLTSNTEYGATYQGRAVWGVKVSDNVHLKEEGEPAILFVGAHHANEWMSIMTPLYLLVQLVENYQRDNDGDGFLNEDPINGKDDDLDGEKDEDPSEGFDNDGDGLTNEDPLNGKDDDDDGTIDEDPPEGLDPANGIDDDGNGLLDDDINTARISWLVDNREIWIVPLLNPDGYAYDRTISEPGSGFGWRKNVRDNDGSGGFDPRFDGVDINRNYPYHWHENQQGVIDDGGLEYTSDSSNPTSSMYRGPQDNHDQDGDSILPAPDWWDPRYRPDWNGIDEDPWNGIDDDRDGRVDEDKDGGFSEPETQALEELLKKLDFDNDFHDGKNRVILSVSYHNYGEWVIWPWGYISDPPPHEPLLSDIGHKIMDYTAYRDWKGEGMYMTAGDQMDWLYGSHGVLPYTVELNNGDQGGHHPHEEYILETCRLQMAYSLYLLEIADVSVVARDHFYDSIDSVSLPTISHEQPSRFASDFSPYRVEATVINTSNLLPDSLYLHYSVDGGAYKKVRMEPSGENEDQGIYKGRIPSQDDGSVVMYYFTGEDIRGIEVHNPAYSTYEPYTYTIDSGAFFNQVDFFLTATMTILFFSIIYVSLARGIFISFKAQKRKTRKRFA